MTSPTLGDLAAAITGFTSAVAGADPATAVPGCPTWTVTDLVHHVAEVHQWAAHAVLAGTPDGVPQPPPQGLDAAALSDWYAGHAERLRRVLADTAPDAPAWTFGPHPRTAGWWVRHQTHEVLVHTWDVAAAGGGSLPLEAALAWDAVDEVATVFYPRQVRLGRAEPLTRTLVLQAADLPGADVVRLGEGPEHPVTGPAAEVLLTLWRRRPADDPVVAEALAAAIVP